MTVWMSLLQQQQQQNKKTYIEDNYSKNKIEIMG